VRDEVEREVERRDRADDPDRQPKRQPELAGAGRGGIHRDDLACELARLDCREGVGGHSALGLDSRLLQRLARLRRDQLRRVLLALFEQPCGRIEDACAFVRGQRLAQGAGRGVERATRLGRSAFGDSPDELVGER